jgi:hypothetical protein
MADDKARPAPDDRVESAMESAMIEPVAQHALPSQGDTAARSTQQTPPGRKPLFRR